MSKVRPFRTFTRDDYEGAPTWFFDFLDGLNQFVSSVSPLFQSGIDLDNNIMCERQTVNVSHGVPITIRLQRLTTTPRLVRVGYAAGYVGSAAITTYNGDGTFAVTVYFHGTAPTAAVSTTLIMEP